MHRQRISPFSFPAMNMRSCYITDFITKTHGDVLDAISRILLNEMNSIRSRPGKPNQRKADSQAVREFGVFS